ncbi:MAG: hypothetical protein RLZZ511_3121 [Cyanobacteriota bacterium]|jgi:ParB family chromosome partitioning protein
MVAKSQKPYAQMRGVAAFLGTPLNAVPPATSNSHSSVIEVSLNEIILPSNQPRKYFDPAKLHQLAISIGQHGLLEPLLVRKHDNGYELVAGERRYRAAQLPEAGLATIPVKVMDLTDQTAWEIAMLENLQREDLNPLEETEGMLQLFALRFDLTIAEVISLLHRMKNEEAGKVSTQNVLSSEQAVTIQTVFEEVGRTTWQSFVSTRLPILNLPEDVLDVLRDGSLEYTKGKAIARVDNLAQRRSLTKQAITKGWSISQIREKVAALLEPDATEAAAQTPKARAASVFKQVNRSKIWDDPKKAQKLDKLLSNLEALLADS